LQKLPGEFDLKKILLKSSFNMTAHDHTRLETQEAVTELRQTFPVHPPYSPDLACSDFHLFGALKDAIDGRKFGSGGRRVLKK
jgi:hypothetical protein